MATRLPPRLSALRLPVAVAVAATAVYVLVSRALIDDAYITMAYARNLAFHLHWGLIADETANSATSPLNVIALAVITAVVRNAQVAVGVLFVAAAVLAARWLADLGEQLELSRALPVVAVGLLLLNPLLLSTVGLEPYLTAALFAGLLRYGAARRGVAFGVLAGLTVLARPDCAVVVVVVAVVLRPGWVRAIGAALLVTVPWYVFSWLALGSALPDTLIIKAGERWSTFGFWNGPALYLTVYRGPTVLGFLPVVLGVPVLVGLLVVRLRAVWAPWQRAAAAAGLAAVAHYGVYGLLRTAPYHWYYAPLIIGTTLCFAIAAARLSGRFAAVCAVVPAALACASLFVDLQHGLPWQRALITTNWATPAEYQRMGQDLHGIVGTHAVESPGEIGTLAYYCDCAIVDDFSDRGRVIDAIEASERKSDDLAAALLRLNYDHLNTGQQPRPVAYHLHYESRLPPSGPDQWPSDNWIDGPSRIVLLRS
ncbi:MAG TPA: hypothetical protein VGE11_26660 [Pseudonocardia sp.]